MLEFIVNTKAELCAAIRAAAQTTFEKAHQNPVRIQFGTARYTFLAGITERRAKKLIRNANEFMRGAR